REIVRAARRRYRWEDRGVGRAGGEPIGVRLLNAVMRRDFQAATPILWGSFDGMALARALGMPVPVFLNRIMMQFEVDYRLFMRIFLWDGPAPHYQIGPQSAFLDVADVMRRQAADRGQRTEDRRQRTEDGGQRTEQPDSSLSSVVRPLSSAPKAGWDISADVITAQTNSRPATVLIAADRELTETFHHNGDASRRGLIVPVPDLFDETGKLTLYAR